MLRENAHHLPAFVAVARERSFTQAARKLGVIPIARASTISMLAWSGKQRTDADV